MQNYPQVHKHRCQKTPRDSVHPIPRVQEMSEKTRPIALIDNN